MSLDELDLLDWKRRVFALYAEVRASDDPEAAWRRWCDVRDELYGTHPQSPRAGARPAYFPYDASLRFEARVEPVAPASLEIAGSAGSVTRFTRFAVGRFEAHALELYWLEAYGGGVFLPFRDETSGRETYGAGRYLLDTVKGADLGGSGDTVVLDFNFAFNPSCAWDEAWACPLAPPANRLPFRVAGGEKIPPP
ncbi:MAG TPA: DUF1684 domain-containing protein [Gaiellaceae bacterium]|nr:DUF1684 domain-containing protein [Gaiellaceae bacterium]